MSNAAAPLPGDPELLRQLCAQLQATIADQEGILQAQKATIQQQENTLKSRQKTIDYLSERLALLLGKRYQAQSEQLKAIQGQLFDEAELETAIRETEAELERLKREGEEPEQPPSKGPRQQPRRKPLPDHLRRVDIVIDVSDEDKQLMGDDWVVVGHDISEQLAVCQREHYVKRFLRVKYVRRQPPNDGEEAGIRVAPAPTVMLPRSLADSSLLADVITCKYVDALSFYRTERILKRDGIEIGYSTLCAWPIQLFERLQPLQALLMAELGQAQLWHLDETTLQVLQEPGRKAQTKSYLWGIRAGPPERPVVLFHYHERRNYDALQAWLAPALATFNGVIVSDDHKPYNRLTAEHGGIQAHGGCWAHCRRKFADAAKGRRSGSEAHRMLQLIAGLYRLDGLLDSLEPAARKQARQAQVQPQLDKIRTHLNELAGQYPQKGLMHTAIGYALNNWTKLTAFIDYPELPLDNNPMERAIRPFTLGRKNWIFAGSPRGAEASAFLYSLVETAKANGWEPKAYLTLLFERYPFSRTDEQRRDLLPMYLKPSTATG